MDTKNDSIIEPKEEFDVIKTNIFDEFQADNIEENQLSLLITNRSVVKNSIENIDIKIKINDIKVNNNDQEKIIKAKNLNIKTNEIKINTNTSKKEKKIINKSNKNNNIYNNNIYKKDYKLNKNNKRKGHKRVFSINLQIEKNKYFKSQVNSPKNSNNMLKDNISKNQLINPSKPLKKMKIKKNKNLEKAKNLNHKNNINVEINNKNIKNPNIDAIKINSKIIFDLIENCEGLDSKKLNNIDKLLNKLLDTLKD